MKKTYISPEALTVSLNTSNIIATSPLNVTGESGTATLNNTQATYNADALVKEDKNVWSDEW